MIRAKSGAKCSASVRVERDFYWDPNMTGHNWKKIGGTL